MLSLLHIRCVLALGSPKLGMEVQGGRKQQCGYFLLERGSFSVTLGEE